MTFIKFPYPQFSTLWSCTVQNLSRLASKIMSPTIFAHVRAAYPGETEWSYCTGNEPAWEICRPWPFGQHWIWYHILYIVSMMSMSLLFMCHWLSLAPWFLLPRHASQWEQLPPLCFWALSVDAQWVWATCSSEADSCGAIWQSLAAPEKSVKVRGLWSCAAQQIVPQCKTFTA